MPLNEFENNLKKEFLGNPGTSYSDQAVSGMRSLGGLPAKGVGAALRGVDSFRNIPVRNGQRQGKQGNNNTRQDLIDLGSNALTSIFGNGQGAGKSRFSLTDVSPQRRNQINTGSGGAGQQRPAAAPSIPNLGQDTQNQGLPAQNYSNPFEQRSGGLEFRQQSRKGTNDGRIQISDNSGEGYIDFGSPEKNAAYAEKMRNSRGTFNVLGGQGQGNTLGDNYANSIAGDTSAQVMAAVKSGAITAAEGLDHIRSIKQGLNLTPEQQQQELERAALGGDENAMKLYQQQQAQAVAQLGAQQAQANKDRNYQQKELENNKTTYGYDDQTGELYPKSGGAGDEAYFSQKQSKAKKTNTSRLQKLMDDGNLSPEDEAIVKFQLDRMNGIKG